MTFSYRPPPRIDPLPPDTAFQARCWAQDGESPLQIAARLGVSLARVEATVRFVPPRRIVQVVQAPLPRPSEPLKAPISPTIPTAPPSAPAKAPMPPPLKRAASAKPSPRVRKASRPRSERPIVPKPKGRAPEPGALRFDGSLRSAGALLLRFVTTRPNTDVVLSAFGAIAEVTGSHGAVGVVHRMLREGRPTTRHLLHEHWRAVERVAPHAPSWLYAELKAPVERFLTFAWDGGVIDWSLDKEGQCPRS